MQQIKCQCLYIQNVVFCKIMLVVFLVTQVILVCILWQSCQISALCNTIKFLFVSVMDITREQYNVKHYVKHKIVLLEAFLLCLYLPPNWLVYYLRIYHNNITHISSVVADGVYSYCDTLLSYPCLQRYCKYDKHEVLLNHQRFQKYNWIFHQIFCFTHCGFYI